MKLAERVEEAILTAEPSTLLGRARLKVAITARRALIRLGDPIVRYEVDGIELELPLSHELPFYTNDHSEYDRAIGRIAKEVGGPVVDVGANVGDTAARIRAACDVPILCVEGDERFFGLLARNAQRLGNVELERAFVGAPPRGRVERRAGTARVVAGDEELPTKQLRDLLDEHLTFSKPGLLKLDTDGMDMQIVLTNLDLLGELRPVLFVEYDPHLGADPVVFERLHEAGYRSADWYENTGEFVARVDLPGHRHDEYVGYAGARYADVCVWP